MSVYENVQKVGAFGREAKRLVAQVVENVFFRIALVFALVFGTYNTWGGYSLYDNILLHLHNFVVSVALQDLIGLGIVAAFTAAFATVVTRAFPESPKLRLGSYIAWCAILLIGAVFWTTIFQRWHWLELIRALFNTALTVGGWYFVFKFGEQMMGRTLFFIAVVAAGLGMILLYSWLGVGVTRDRIITFAQFGIALVFTVGILWPRIRLLMTGTPSVVTQEHIDARDTHDGTPVDQGHASDVHDTGHH